MTVRTGWCTVVVLVGIGLAIVTPCHADMSAEMGALLSDLLKPYQVAGTAPPGTDPQVFARTLTILKNEGFLGLPRPTTGRTDIADRLGKALALGTRTQQFLGEISSVYNALSRGDKRAARDAIREVYRKAGRTAPDGAALDKLYNDVQAAYGTRSVESERFDIKGPDYTIAGMWAPAAGKVKMEVAEQGKPDRKPFRTTFEADVVALPDGGGTGLELGAQPSGPPRTATAESTQALRDQLNGTWMDQSGRQWEITGNGSSVSVATRNRNGRLVVYPSRYDLGKVAGAHVIAHSDDMEDLPLGVRQELAASWKPSYRIELEVAPNGDWMEGTWSSQHVTYSGMDHSVKKIHDPYHVRLRLTRPARNLGESQVLWSLCSEACREIETWERVFAETTTPPRQTRDGPEP